MELIGQILQGIGGLGSLACLILVWVQMFKRGHSGLGIACVVLTFCCGIGGLVTYVFGWMRSGEWGITNIMLAWTVCLVLAFVGGLMSPATYQQLQMRGLPGQ